MRSPLILSFLLLAGLSARADVEVEETGLQNVTYTCRPATGQGPWAMRDTDGGILGVDPQKANFELHPKVQTALICGNAVRTPEAEIQIYPSIEVRSHKKGTTPSFERLPEGGFKFWLSLAAKKRGCEIVCVKN
ncbi:MAG: hypothetical protein KF767_10920 [Bdellovibrionaceae bacterium]|nr:hypothetical protein [Pseudobdellovibrionaceae bacterium]